ncbi:MAG: SIMPL domain-containing protein [Clostridia bacterium]|nr:SIMPL domain-containing protein [Clostridia bacterium]
MNRTINVRGVGTAKTKPDQVVLSLELNAKDLEYQKAVSLADEQIGELTAALAEAGFEKDALKTAYFNVNTSYEGYQDEKGIYRQRFDGYVVNHSLRLYFDFSPEELSKTLSAIAGCNAKPQLNISFTVKDPAGIKAQILRDAARNAREKAELLTEASGVRLGRLIGIDYNWGEVNVTSRSRFDVAEDECAMKACAFGANLTPEDVTSSDSAAFTWELTD